MSHGGLWQRFHSGVYSFVPGTVHILTRRCPRAFERGVLAWLLRVGFRARGGLLRVDDALYVCVRVCFPPEKGVCLVFRVCLFSRRY